MFSFRYDYYNYAFNTEMHPRFNNQKAQYASKCIH